MRVLVGRGGGLVGLGIDGFVTINHWWAYDAPAVVADLPITRDELEATCARLLTEKGWTDVDELAAEMADSSIELAAHLAVGTQLEAEFDDDTEEWRFYTVVDDDDDGMLVVDVIPPP